MLAVLQAHKFNVRKH